MNKLDVQQALARLQGAAEDLEAYGHEYGRTRPAEDAKLVRRFLNADRQEILVLRRYVLLGANTLAEQSGGGSEQMESMVAEMREAARPKRKAR